MNQNAKVNPSPLVFVLKEGEEIKNNYLDYSLLLLHTNCLEALSSPLQSEKSPSFSGPVFFRLQDEIERKKLPPAPPHAIEIKF